MRTDWTTLGKGLPLGLVKAGIPVFRKSLALIMTS